MASTTHNKHEEVLELVKAHGQWSVEQLSYCDRACIDRYLRARHSDVHKAANMLIHTLEWRKENHIDALHPKEFEEDLTSAHPRQFVAGIDPQGQPVMLLRKDSEPYDNSKSQHHIRYLMFTLETLVRCMDQEKGQEKWIWIMDMKHYSRKSQPPYSVSSSTQKIFADHYPERLQKAYIVDAPNLFYYLYKIISPFIDHVTRSKICFVFSKDYENDGTYKHGKHGSNVDPSGFSEYYKLYTAEYNQTSYMEMLKRLGWE